MIYRIVMFRTFHQMMGMGPVLSPVQLVQGQAAITFLKELRSESEDDF